MSTSVLPAPTITAVQFDHRKMIEELTNGAVPQMKSATEESRNSYTTAEESRTRTGGMDCLPEETYNALVEHCIRSGKLRDAMFLICAVNWGTRFSDTVKVRFCHIFNRDGEFLDKFTLPNGEKKTTKQNFYFNNRATKAIIKMYLAANPRTTPSEYMFVSKSGNAPHISLDEVELMERCGIRIEVLEKSIRKIDSRLEKLIDLCADMIITKEQYLQKKTELQQEKLLIQGEIEALKAEIKKSLGDSDRKIMIQKPMSSTQAQNIIKDNLAKIGVFPLNRKDKSKSANIEEKYNTHSMRKTFGETFYQVGVKLKDEGIIEIDYHILKLLQEKYLHSNMDTTGHYNKEMEKAFKIICCNMNVGMEAIVKAMELK